MPRRTRLPWDRVDLIKPAVRPLYRRWRVVVDDTGYILVGFITFTRWQQLSQLIVLVEAGVIPDVEVRLPHRWRGSTADRLRHLLGQRTRP